MFTISLEFGNKEPIYEQIYKYIRKEIVDGRIPCGTKLPSCRGLASDLSVSRSTIDMAYAQLVSEGYIEAFPQKGYFVSDLEYLYEEGIQIKEQRDLQEEATSTSEEESNYIDFSLSGVDMDFFPYDKWRRLMKEALIDDNKELFLSGNHQGDIILRKSICNYIHQSRGVNCKPSQIIIGAGSDYLLLLLCRILNQTKHIAVENPAYIQANTIFEREGIQTSFIDIDEQGISLEQLEVCGADVVYVTPSHQFPSGVVMSARRRQKLLAWSSKKNERYIIEDDYDSEFRYYGRPIPSLQSRDPFNKVIYMGTLSKVIAPGIRLSYMVLPDDLIKRYQENCGFYFSTVSRIDQMVIHQFFAQGFFERHLNRMRKIYKNKHDILLKEVRASGLPCKIKGENAGLHILLEFGNTTKDAKAIEKRIVSEAYMAGIKIYAFSDFFLEEREHIPTIMLGFARLKDQDIEKGIRILEDVFMKTFTFRNGNVIFDID